ncbi:MAG: hypothetical protein R6V58_02820 [Planctomycetota bacterium]
MPEQVRQPWWETEGIRDGGLPHEPVAFMRRRGGCHEDIEERYERVFSEESARELAEAGYNFVEFVFFKGLGLEAEEPEMERSKRFIEHLHKHGVKAGVYTQWGSVFTDTFFHEIPEARDWVQIGVDGKPIEYGDRIHQYFRWRGCPGNPDFIAFIKRVCKLAIEEYNVDVIYFDNMCLFEGHDTLCYCDHCRRGFREYLMQKYPTPESSWERFGLWRVDGVDLPPFHPWRDYTEAPRPIIDPVMQEFIEFRCEQLADAWLEVYEYIQSVDPGVGLMGNPSFPRKYNERLTSAIDFWRLRDATAMYYMENAVGPVGVRDEAISSNAHGYKYGRALGPSVRFVPCGGSDVPGLIFCEGLAFNDGSGTLGHGYEPYFEFFKAHKDEFYRDVEPAAEVAVLRHDGSLTWRWHEAYTVMRQAQQQLLCGGIPWMPLWGQQLFEPTLDRYKVLVVPGCACLNREELDAIFGFVEGGGSAIILENAGTFDESHRQISRWRFAPLFESVADPAGFEMRYKGRTGPGTFDGRRLMEASSGAGRAVYIPQIRPEQDAMPGYRELGGYRGLQHLRLPANWQALPEAVIRVARLGLWVSGPNTLFCEALKKTDGRRTFVHLVNYADEPVDRGAEVFVADAARSAQLYIPDRSPDPEDADMMTTRRGAAVRLPSFVRYALLVLE